MKNIVEQTRKENLMKTTNNTPKEQQIKRIEQAIQKHQFSGIFAEYHGDFETYCLINGRIDLDKQEPIQLDTLFGIASGTKFFTALAIGQLIDEGHLTLDTPALQVLDLGNPLLDKNMTIRQLLNNTSGFPDYLDESIISDQVEVSITIPNSELVSPFDYLPLFPKTQNTSVPGAVFKYNNGGYVYLAMIIETISGLSYGEYMNEKLLRPLGLTRSGVYPVNDLPYNTAKGYYQVEGVEHVNTELIPYQAGGDGGIYTTVSEMKKLWELFIDGKIISSSLLEQYLKPSICAYPELGIYYGLGFWIKKASDTLYIPYITGSDIGVSFKTSYHPELKRTIVHVSNTSDGVWQLNQIVNAFE